MPITFLGLDIGTGPANFSLTRDGTTFENGTVSLKAFPDFLASHGVAFVGCEYTGRLAERWLLAAKEAGAMGYILHSVDRRALNVMARQSVKTDKRDAETIAHFLYLFVDKGRRGSLRLSNDLFTEAETVRLAWQLRSMLASVDELIKAKVGAKNRMTVAGRVGNAHMASIWREAATSDAPERALAGVMAFAREHFAAEIDLLRSIPGIGEKTALVLCAALLPIERFTETDAQTGQERNTAFSRNLRRYAGLYPKVEQSGKMSKGQYLSRRGNPHLRSALWMSAMNQTQAHSLFGRYYARLKEKGKPGKAAVLLTAVKMLAVAGAVLRTKKPYFDPLAKPAEPKPRLPDYLVSQSEAARRLGCSRQRVGQLIKADVLRSEVWGKKPHVVVKYLDILMENKKEAGK